MKRSFSVTLTAWLVLFLTSSNLLRAWTAFAWSRVLAEFPGTFPAGLSGLIGLFWAGVGLFLLWSIWKGETRAKMLLPALAAGYSAWYWFERIFLQTPRPNLMFAVIVNLVLLSIIYSATRSLSREAYERNYENPTTE
ncbi:MAG TPA: hypothetical protein PKL78_06755 [Anaerolineales bacterium]|nr:hypothetical protein [Anaerolineales bacterium]HNO30280.1 hypothetical protein [Anaerolineales bacterium]